MIVLSIGPNALNSLASTFVMFGYLGPDSIIPLASIVAAMLGFILLFWNRLLGVARKLLGRVRGDRPAESPGAGNEQANLPGPKDETKA